MTVKDATTELPEQVYRLPRDIAPVRYELTLEPDLTEFTFTGTCETEITVTGEQRTILLNAIELDILAASVRDADGRTQAATSIELDADNERAALHFEAPIPSGAILRTEFTGILNDKLHGFYRSTFLDDDGNEQVIATTQFEATDARRAFPCWDEPDFKAVFGVTLVVDEGLLALSNAGEIGRETRDDGKVVVRFADTMKMSTYLVAFIVGPLDVTDPVIANGKPLRVAYPRGKGHLTSYALEVGKFCLEFFADFYGIDYPGDKLDLVAVPDFAFGAMENLGCVTFREVLVLVDPDKSTQPELQNVTDVIAHELAHMWFGDLVTMKWWNGIWLNEAFATFMEMLATDAFRPEWDRWTTFGLSRTAAFDVDSLKTTRPIEFPVISPDDAEGMFDILTYEKGAAVVRMLEQYLGADEFREGIRLYLSKHAYGNTETTDLWDALEESTGEPVRRMMDTWIFQGGYPVISVEIEHNDLSAGEAGMLRFRQRHFGFAGDIGEDDPEVDAELDGEQWIVPLIFSQRAQDITTFEKVLIEQRTLEIPLLEPVEWVLVNTEGTGFYRADYADDLRDSLVTRAADELSPIERYGLVDDAWASVLADRMTAPAFLAMLRRFDREDDLSVWQRMITGLSSLDRLVDGDARSQLQRIIREMAQPSLDRLGLTHVDGQSDRDDELRGSLLDVLGVLGKDQPTITIARDLFDSAERSPGGVDPSVLAAAISIIASLGQPEDFDTFHAKFKAADNPQEELRYLSALADFDEPTLLGRLLDMTLTDEVRTQNAPYLLRRAMANREHGFRAWQFVTDHWEDINQRFPSNSIVRMLEGVRGLSRPEQADAVFSFFEEHEVPQGDKTLAQHLERLEVNVALRRRESERLTESLT